MFDFKILCYLLVYKKHNHLISLDILIHKTKIIKSILPSSQRKENLAHESLKCKTVCTLCYESCFQ